MALTLAQLMLGFCEQCLRGQSGSIVPIRIFKYAAEGLIAARRTTGHLRQVKKRSPPVSVPICASVTSSADGYAPRNINPRSADCDLTPVEQTLRR
jgi:hypothetical protein